MSETVPESPAAVAAGEAASEAVTTAETVQEAGSQAAEATQVAAVAADAAGQAEAVAVQSAEVSEAAGQAAAVAAETAVESHETAQAAHTETLSVREEMTSLANELRESLRALHEKIDRTEPVQSGVQEIEVTAHDDSERATGDNTETRPERKRRHGFGR